MMHSVRGFFRFAHNDGLIVSDPDVHARLPKVHRDESRTQGLARLELIRFLQLAQTLTVHQDNLAYLLGINALRASEAAAVRIEDYAETLRGHRVLHRDAYRMVTRIAKGRPHPAPHQPRSLRHAAITNTLGAGVPLRDAQILARHADRRVTEHYDRTRGNLDRHAARLLTAHVTGV